MVGIDVLTTVASMAKRKITIMTPMAARLRLAAGAFRLAFMTAAIDDVGSLELS